MPPMSNRQYWRSLEELAETEDFQRFLSSEFPEQASDWKDPVSRRELLRVMGASLVLAGLAGCAHEPVGKIEPYGGPPSEKIVPYVRAPEEVVPGKPLFFATAMALGGFAKGLLVKSHTGRPIKVEGNPEHPASLGATDVFAQAAVLTLYDPDRAQVVLNRGTVSTWPAFLAALNMAREEQRFKKGAGLRILTETVTSPTLADQLQSVLAEFPAAKWHQYDPVTQDNIRAGARLAFGEDVNTIYLFDKADVVLALEADFLGRGPADLRYTHDFISRRRVREGQSAMNRLYVAEHAPSVTGSMADHRLRLQSGQIRHFALAVAVGLGIVKGPTPPLPGVEGKFLDALIQDLRKHPGSSIVVAGERQPPVVHALAHAINHALNNVGNTVIYTDPIEANPANQMQSLRELTNEMNAGAVDVLLILGGNPVFTAPRDLPFTEALSKVKLRVHLGLYEDETSNLCHWHIPAAHFLETWGDARAHDGTVTVMQPLIAPLYGGKSVHEMLAVLLGKSDLTPRQIVHDYWRKQNSSQSFEDFWQITLHDGLMAGTAFPSKNVTLKTNFLAQAALPGRKASGLELNFEPDPTIWDGRFANNGWLQELPKPLTKLTWDNAAMMSPATAERLRLATEDVVELRYQGASVRAPIWVMPGHADDSVTVHLGYGRTRTGRVGTGTGFNPYPLRTSAEPWFGHGLEIRKTGERYKLVSTQHQSSMENRGLVRVATIGQYQQNPYFVREFQEPPPPGLTIYPGYQYNGYAWGMAIDLNACIGCGACVVACQAENNSPVVGKREVGNGRHMHWIRVDRYYHGGPDDPAIYHEPVPCMHCENAPCELVCPVGATLHSDEGLNQMVYNRCVGTRYCSNNCPYKVRRFNFFQYSDYTTPSLKLLRNPNVTVRSRGVMEKCTYCVQRINAAKIQAEEENRTVRDGEIVTACQAVCPADAIVFGDINDPNSRVARLKAEPRNYGLLTELNTRPRTTYLGRLRNPNPDIEGEPT
jgi:MoCo/4Fe-4S cofactor protein with predicted Tat translocation signal